MDSLFKKGSFSVIIPVRGETDNYEVTIRFEGVVDELHKQMDRFGKFDIKTVMKALTSCFDGENVYLHCSCPDFCYRFSYWSTKNKYNSGPQQPSNGKWIRNPNDKLGACCKHGLLVLSNNSWLLLCARVIYNYVTWMSEHREQMYAEQIYPVIYGKEYEDPYQTDLLNTDELDSDEEEIGQMQKHKGRDERGRFNREQEKG